MQPQIQLSTSLSPTRHLDTVRRCIWRSPGQPTLSGSDTTCYVLVPIKNAVCMHACSIDHSIDAGLCSRSRGTSICTRFLFERQFGEGLAQEILPQHTIGHIERFFRVTVSFRVFVVVFDDCVVEIFPELVGLEFVSLRRVTSK